MKCPYCNCELLDGSKFCDNCGQEIPTTVGSSQVSKNYWEDYQSKAIKDVSAYQAKVQKEHDEQKVKRNKIILAILAVACIIALVIYVTVIHPAQQYSKATELFENEQYEEAVSIFESLDDYKDAADLLQKSKFYWAEQLFNNDDYYQARSIWESLNGYNGAKKYVDECNIAIAEQLIQDNEIAKAAVLLGTVSTSIPAQRQCFSLWEKLVYPTYLDADYYKIVGLTQDGKIITTDSKSSPVWNAWNSVISVYYTSEGVVALNTSHTLYTAFDQYCDYDVSDWHNIVDIKAEGQFIIGLKSDGTVLATVDDYGNDSNWAYSINEWTDIIYIAASNRHILGIKADGTVVAVGDYYAKEQCNVSGWRNVVDVAAGYEHSVALKSDGTVVAVGKDCDGYTSSGTPHSDGRLNTNNWTNIVRVFAGRDYTVGLKADGTVVATGGNSYGQCDVSDWTDIVDIVTDSNLHCTIGIKSDGSVVTTRKSDISEWSNLKTTQIKIWE